MSNVQTRKRPTRAEEEAPERRRRDANFDVSLNQRLPVDESLLDQKNYTYRFFNDEPGRIRKYTTHDDWDPVTTEELGGAETKHFVGYHPDGSPLFAHLYKKRRVWHDKDQNAKIAKSKEEEQELLRRVPSAQGGLDESKGYTTAEINRVSGGVTRIEGDPDLRAREADDDA